MGLFIVVVVNLKGALTFNSDYLTQNVHLPIALSV